MFSISQVKYNSYSAFPNKSAVSCTLRLGIYKINEIGLFLPKFQLLPRKPKPGYRPASESVLVVFLDKGGHFTDY